MFNAFKWKIRFSGIYEELSSRSINTCVFFVCAASQWKLSGRKIFGCPQNCATRTNIFANIHFLLTKHISCWWSALSCSWPSLRGSYNMESIFQDSIHFPSCWFLQRVTHCFACSSISDISRSNAIIFHRISGSLSLLCLLSSLVPWQAVGPCSLVWRGLSSDCLRQLRPSLAHFLPGSGDVDCDHHARHLQVEAAGVFRGIMRRNE